MLEYYKAVYERIGINENLPVIKIPELKVDVEYVIEDPYAKLSIPSIRLG